MPEWVDYQWRQGRLQEQTDEDLRGIVLHHLLYNNYPPLDERMATPVVKAIRAVREGEPDRKVRLPKGAKFAKRNGRPTSSPPAWQLLEYANWTEEGPDGFSYGR